jgi:flagellar basal body-associated protein FliL
VQKSKRANYLIDKPFQLGFISRFVLIIIITIIVVFGLTGCYYWVLSNFGEFKLNTSLTYIQQGYIKKDGKQVYSYDKEKIEVYKDTLDGKPVYKAYRTFAASTNQYQPDTIVENVDEKQLQPKIGPVTQHTDRFKILIFPLIMTAVILIIVISVYSLFFSHRMAGPVYRMRVSLDRLLAGDYDFKIQVRKNDFFTNIVNKLEELRQQIIKKK